MAIYRYTASADNTITNAFKAGLSNRGTGSNMGYADALEVFSVYGQTLTTDDADGASRRSEELTRILIQFPIDQISTDRLAGTIPASGSVSFHLKMANAETPFTLPQDFTLVILPVSQSWTEGSGLDMAEYQDLGVSNWLTSSGTTPWTSVGGDYLSASNQTASATFPEGYEDLEVDISHIVEQWIDGTFSNYGLGVHLTATQEAYYSSSTGADDGNIINNPSGSTDSYYTKRFFARSTQYFFKRPFLEARWDSRVQDDRENFYYSSSVAPAVDNLNKLYLYNYIRGRLVNIPAVGTNDLLVSFYSSSNGSPTGSAIKLSAGGGTGADGDTNVTASYVSRGQYSGSMALTAATTPLEAVHDVWHSGSVHFFTGSVYPELFPTYDSAPTFDRITSCTNLKKVYSTQDTSRFRFFVRSKDWSPTIYTVATANNPTDIITSASFSVRRVTDGYVVVPYGTGSDRSTYLSYDKDGNYFDLNMSLLEPRYMYEITLAYYNDSIGGWQEQPQQFKFRVED